ncbi:MAG: T9SS type A sorting domain-containing protein [Ferruginibacter sp.]
MKKKHLLLLFANLLFLNCLVAQTWDGSTDTNWNTPSNWTPATVPTSVSAVTIGNTANKPALASNTTVASLSMTAGSALNFNGFTLTVNGALNIAGATLNNTNAASDIMITVVNGGSSYFGSNTINDHITINQNGSGAFYESYVGADTYNGNTTFNIAGTGSFIICYSQPAAFNGNLTVTRSGIGSTSIVDQGFAALTGNFSYTNNAGGASSINGGNKLSASIGGTVNITAAGTGNPSFEMRRIKNLTTGGTISVQNSGLVGIYDDTLIVSALNINGFTGGGGDELRRNSITGNVSFSDDAANTGSTYIGGNIITGNTSFTANNTGAWYESYVGADTYNGNTSFNIAGTGLFTMCYSQPDAFNGNLTVTRSGIGATNIVDQGFTALTGNFSYTNNAGGATNINGGNKLSASIGGTVNITAAGTGNPSFEMRRIKNLTTGGTISVQNSGLVGIYDDTLILSALNINGFTGGGGDELRRNSITGNVSFSDDAANTGSTYIGGNIITGNTSFTANNTGAWYESYVGADTYNGNTSFNIAGTGLFTMCYSQPDAFNGNLTVTRSGIGATNIVDQGFTALTGNFSYTNNAGGATNINGGNKLSASIGGTVNITAAGTGNPSFEMRRIKNLTTGGTISVQNSGLVTIDDDTLMVNALNINGFTGGGGDAFQRNSITGNVSFSDAAANTGSTYIGSNIITGNTIFTSNAAGAWYESYVGADTYNGNTTFNIAGTSPFTICYSVPAAFNGYLAVSRSGIGTTNIVDQGFTALTGNFSYTNNAGGSTTINGGNKLSPSIGGTVNVTATGTGNPSFEMRRIKNLVTGGTVSVQNSGLVTILDDTLMVSAFNVNGFTGGGGDALQRNSITGNVSFSDAAANTGSTYIGGNIITGNTSFTSNAANAWYEGYVASDIYNGNFRFNRVAGAITLAYSDTTSFNGDFILNATAGITPGNVLRFGGTTNSIVEQLGTQSIIIPKLFMDKTGAGSIELKDTVTISTGLNLSSGVIKTGVNSNLVIPDGVTYTGGSDVSYVDGPMLKTGNDAFVFPVGQNNGYAPISITAPAVITDQFRAQYNYSIPNNAGYDSAQKDPTLKHISNAEYWLLDRVNGTSNVKVTLSWGTPRSGGINDVASLRVARWNGSTWKDEGNGGTTGNNTQGTIQSLNTVTSFSPFTLASASLLNPLPVTIVSFTAVKQQQAVSLSWTTENEKNFSHFEIERAGADNNFNSIGRLSATNSPLSQQYLFNDETPARGVNFYRLKMIDIDGKFKYSKVISINFSSNTSLVVYPNPASDYIRIVTAKKIKAIEVADVSGRIVKRMNANNDNRYDINDLQKGVYFLNILDEDNNRSSKKLIVE